MDRVGRRFEPTESGEWEFVTELRKRVSSAPEGSLSEQGPEDSPRGRTRQ